jgi:hypothetical protein
MHSRIITEEIMLKMCRSSASRGPAQCFIEFFNKGSELKILPHTGSTGLQKGAISLLYQ